MKPSISKNLTLVVTTLAIALTSCVAGLDNSVVFGPGEGEPVIITFNPGIEGAPTAPATRAYHDPGELIPGDGEQGSDAIGRDPEDVEVTDIRVLLYKSSTGQYVAGDQAIVTAQNQPVELELVTGLYDVVLIANASSDIDLTSPPGKLDNVFGTPVNHNTITKVKNALLDSRAFDSRVAGRGDTPIPMFALVRDVHISLDGSVQVADGPSQNTHTTPWAPTLERTGVRLSMAITLTPYQYDDWVAAGEGVGKIEITRLPAESWLWNSGKFNGSLDRREPDTSPRVYTAFDGYTKHVAADEEKGIDEHYLIRYDRIIVPELLFDDTDNADLAAVLSMDMAGGLTVSGRISGPDPAISDDGFTLPRNLWLHLDVSIAGSRLEVIPRVIPWNNLTGGGTIGNKEWLRAKGPIYIANVWPQSFDAVTSLDNVALLREGGNPKIDYIDGGSGWLTITEAAATTSGTEGTTATKTRTITVQANADNTGRYRRARVLVTAGEGAAKLEKWVEVIHTSGIPASPGVIGYVASGSDYGTLTLRGSRDYSGTPVGDAAGAMFPGQGLHPETVYSAYFKWGSLVALSSELGDSSFDAGDIVAAPVDYDDIGYPVPALEAVRTASEGNFSKVPFRTGDDAFTNGWKSAPVKGLGDPCAYYFTDWHLPLGGALSASSEPARTYGGWNAGTFGITDDESSLAYPEAHSQWFPAGVVGAGTPAGIRAGDGSYGHPADWSMFLPATGYRNAISGSIIGQGDGGAYWSSTVEFAQAQPVPGGEVSTAGPTGYSLYYTSDYIFPSNFYSFPNAFAIRCVKQSND